MTDSATRETTRSFALSRIDPAVIGPSVALFAMFIIYSIFSPHFLTVQNVTNVLVQCAPLLILAAGQTFAVLMGGLDLSQGSIVSLVSVVTAGVMMDDGIATGAAAGLGSGLLVGLCERHLDRAGAHPAFYRNTRHAVYDRCRADDVFRRVVNFGLLG